METQETQGKCAEFVALPSLKDTGTRFSSVPRRYEETRPVVIQGFAHRKILCEYRVYSSEWFLL